MYVCLYIMCLANFCRPCQVLMRVSIGVNELLTVLHMNTQVCRNKAQVLVSIITVLVLRH